MIPKNIHFFLLQGAVSELWIPMSVANWNKKLKMKESNASLVFQKCLKPFKTWKTKCKVYNIVARFIDIIENHRPVPLPVTPKLLQKIAFVSKPEKDCLITNKICWPKKHWGFMAIASINLCIVTAFCV